jgi:hypothetical protein
MPSKDTPGGSADTPRCGLCGKTHRLTRTRCCDQWICDDADQYVLFSYSNVSCYRNHDRYTLCAHHHREGHPGRWQDCPACRYNMGTEMYVWSGTNKYNFVRLENPPSFEPTRCADCGRVIHLGTEEYLISGSSHYCSACSRKRMPPAH